MSATSRDDILDLLGDVDDLIVERLIATGATLGEIGAALDAEEAARDTGRELVVESSPRVAAVRAILEEVLDDNEDFEASLEASPP